jgi:hypothetical protein
VFFKDVALKKRCKVRQFCTPFLQSSGGYFLFKILQKKINLVLENFVCISPFQKFKTFGKVLHFKNFTKENTFQSSEFLTKVLLLEITDLMRAFPPQYFS